MLTRSLADARDRGELVSVLRAAEWPIYGRYGYSCASRASTYKVRVDPRPHILAPIDPVTVVQIEPAELADPTGGGPGPAVLARRRRQQPGHIDRDHSFWERILGLNGLTPNSKTEPVCVLATDCEGNDVGYAIWTAREGDWFEEKVEVTLHELITVTDDAFRALWGYLINLDLVKTINWAEQAPDEPLEWLLDDGRAARQDWTYDDLWLRILDTPGALSARRYSVEDALILQVVDDDAGGWGAGRFLLDGGPHHAACTRAGGRSADLQLSQRALAAVYLSGQTLLSQAAAGLVDEQTPGALRRLELMLAEPRSPWNSTQF
jgi:predicted acetyltransferase